MHTPRKRRGPMLLLLTGFYLGYGIHLLNPNSLAVHLPDFEGTPQFTAIDASEIQYATNTSSTILRIGGFHYLWRGGAWFRSSTSTGIYWKTDALPPELLALERSPAE